MIHWLWIPLWNQSIWNFDDLCFELLKIYANLSLFFTDLFLPPAGERRCDNIGFWLSFSRNVVTTLFSTSLLRRKSGVVRMLCFWRRFSNQILPLQRRHVFNFVFLTKIQGFTTVIMISFFQSYGNCHLTPAVFEKQNWSCML